MLLLLVLTALSFFILLGAFLIISAVRARTAARAFANATQVAAVDGIQSRMLLDEALLIALRGSKDPNVRKDITESILGDKYGTAGSGTGSITFAYNSATPLLTATATGLTLGPPHGRVLTIVPNPALGGPVSFRTAGGTGSTVFLANTPLRPGFPWALLSTTASTYTAFVNGREFSGTPADNTTAAEPWDAYDASNPWLAQPVLSGSDGRITRFERVSFGTSAPPPAPPPVWTVDNDNDGIADGTWLDNVLPSRPSPNGTFTYRVSYLVLDLDGRINVNTAGMADRAQGPYTGTPDVSLGMGYGPADLDPSLVVSSTPALPSATGTSAFTGSGSATPTDLWYTNFLSTGGTTTAGVATASQRRPPPGIPLVGRYGRDGTPGSSGDDTRGSQQTTMSSTAPTRYALTVAGTNAVADLKGQMRVYMRPPASGQITPALTFFVAQTGTDAVDDPYEVQLADVGPRPAAAVSGDLAVNDDNPFTVAELERVLRASDGDAATLPPRLAAGLASVAQASRMRITTDSWDTPAITGSAATRIETSFSGGGIGALAYPWANSNAASPDVAAGLRFDLNRPLTTGTQTQEYCKGLYTLVMALNPSLSAQQAAQWAVNVCDFRDDDSKMTGFEYDTNLANGWNVDGNLTTTNDSDRGVVWGVERPDLLVAETAAWRETTSGSAQLFVNLIRPPWTAAVMTSGSTVASVEQLDPALRAASNPQNLAIANSTGGSPAWQLRFSGTAMAADTSVVQFTALSGSTSQNQHVLTGTGVTSGTSKILGGSTAADALAPGGQCLVAPASPQFFDVTSSPAQYTVSQGGTFAPAPVVTSGTVWLERLADPTRANGIDNPYVAVDAAPFAVCEYAVPATPTLQKRSRPSAGAASNVFWRSPATWTTVTGSAIGAYSVAGTASWFHWPNRPFVSQAELVLVPADSSLDLLRNYDVPTSSLVSGTTALASMLLDATYVPSRFAGCGITVTSSTIAACGLDRLAANQFSTWREPGRVNVNTIPTGTTSLVNSDSLVWATLVGGTTVPLTSETVTVNPFVSTGTTARNPATSTARLLSLTGSAVRPMATGSFVSDDPGLRDRNPFFTYATAIRLANTATIRSHVFAVWITLETTDSGDGSTTCHRLFAIVDRSIPVGFREGENLNVRDTIRLRRFLE